MCAIRTSVSFLSILEEIVWSEVFDFETNYEFEQKWSLSDKKKLDNYNKVIERGRSLYLLADMLTSDEIFLRIDRYLNKLASQ